MGVNNLLRNNFALIIGLCLPVLLVLSFLFASHWQQTNAAPPQYELVFSVMRYDYQSPVHVDFDVKNQTLYARLTPKKEHEGGNVSDLFVYDARKGSVRKVGYLPPPPSDQSIDFQREIPVEALRGSIIDTNSKAPDGYAFESGRYRSRGLLGEIFGGRHSANRVTKAGGGSFVIPDYGDGYGGIRFIGWIVDAQ